MDHILRRTILVLLMTVVCGVIFHAPISVGFGVVFPDLQLLIKAWKEILIVITVVLIAIDVTRHHWWRTLWGDIVLKVTILYVLLHVILLPFMWHGILPTIAALMIDLRYVIFFGVVYIACKFYPSYRRSLIIGGSIAVAVSLFFTLLQVTVLPRDILSYIGYSQDTIVPYMTVDQNEAYTRVNGTLRGPNPLGALAVISLTASVAVLAMLRSRLYTIHKLLPIVVGAISVMSVIALWFSYSRSALIAAVAALGLLFFCIYGKRIPKRVWVAIAVVTLLVGGGVYAARDTYFISHVILHEDPAEGNDINSNEGHWESLVDGTERMLRQPFGAGIGSTGSPSLMTDNGLIIENHFLYVAHETGWVGFGLFTLLCGIVLYYLWQRRSNWFACSMFASGIGLVIASLFLPVWADDTVSLLWWGAAGIAASVSISAIKTGAKNG